jgi:hypothetical protein
MTDELILSEEQMNEMAEQLFERVNETIREDFDKAVVEHEAANPTPAALPPLSEGPVTQLSPVGQEEVAAALSKAEHDPIVPKQMTRQVWKQMMRIHFTIRRGTAPGCGHKLSSINVPNEKGENTIFITSDPRKNCDSCWFTYFNTNGQMTNIADECFREAGRDVLERSRGKRFVKYFLRFMSTIARFQREAAEKAAANGVEVNGTEGSEDSVGGGSPATDSSIGGVAGEAQSIGQVSSDPSVVTEGAVDGSPVEGLGIGVGSMRQGLGDEA